MLVLLVPLALLLAPVVSSALVLVARVMLRGPRGLSPKQRTMPLKLQLVRWTKSLALVQPLVLRGPRGRGFICNRCQCWCRKWHYSFCQDRG